MEELVFDLGVLIHVDSFIFNKSLLILIFLGIYFTHLTNIYREAAI